MNILKIETFYYRSVACTIKHFMTVINVKCLKTTCFVDDSHFHPSLKFAGIATCHLTCFNYGITNGRKMFCSTGPWSIKVGKIY